MSAVMPPVGERMSDAHSETGARPARTPFDISALMRPHVERLRSGAAALVKRLLGPRPVLHLVLLGAFAAVVGGVGIAIGIHAETKQWPQTVGYMVDYAMRQSNPANKGVQSVPWTEVSTNRQTLQVAQFKISNVLTNGGAIEYAGGALLIASPQGQFSYLDPSNQIRPLGLKVRMNLEALRNTQLYKEAQFDVSRVRVLDMLTIPTGPNTYDLYVTFERYMGDCFAFVLGRTPIKAENGVVTPLGGWTDVWTAKPCVPLKERGSIFEGVAGGGRILRQGEDKLLISVGDFQFDGFYSSQQLSAKPDTDLGKIIELDLKTGQATHYATGLRNPEGLTFDSKGRLWETEHGPQGGDELNLIRRGVDYGWPYVTYGMTYGAPPTEWPFSKTPGEHAGYERPRFAFVPSIGAGNVIEPSTAQFPRWSNSLLVASLREQSLILVKLDGDDVVYAEPIKLGQRLRDIISLPDGRLAVLADAGTMLLIRNGEMHAGDTAPLNVTGLDAAPRPSVDEAPQLALKTRSGRGRALFMSACSSCHSLDGTPGGGPSLQGVAGRPIGGAEGFSYSRSLSALKNQTWTEAKLIQFIDHPDAFAPGTTMPAPGLFHDEVGDVVAFLSR